MKARFEQVLSNLNPDGLTAMMAGMDKLEAAGVKIPIDFTGVIFKSPEYYDLIRKMDLLYKFHTDMRFTLHNKLPPVGNDEFGERSSLPIKVKSAECKPSKTHGKGIFATRNIRKGEVITFYPADVIMIKSMYEDKFAYKFKFNDRMVRKYKLKNGESTLAGFDWVDSYLLDFNNTIQISGNPDLCDDPTYLGHMCNDAAVCPPEENHIGTTIYFNILQAKSNGLFVMDRENKLAVVVAYKNIEQGEEIYVPYGPDYWYGFHKGEMNFDSSNADYRDMCV